MAIEPIAYIGLHLGPNPGTNDAVVGVRIVPTGREGNVVYARTLNADEPDTGERITLEVGEQLVLPRGSAKVSIADVDRYAEPEPDGYTAVTNTVWTWFADSSTQRGGIFPLHACYRETARSSPCPLG